MSEDPMVTAPPHYMTGRFGDIGCISFARLMPYCAGNTFKYVWRCEDKGHPVQDLNKALVYWQWAEQDTKTFDPGYRHDYSNAPHIRQLHTLYFRYLEPHIGNDWMARVLGDIIWQEWTAAQMGIEARLEFFIKNGGQP